MQGTVKRTYDGIPEKELPRISKGTQEQWRQSEQGSRQRAAKVQRCGREVSVSRAATGSLTSDSSCSRKQLSRNRSDRSTDFLALFMEVASAQDASPSERHWNQSGCRAS